MKFLCLPGAYGSAKNFSVQLGPLAEELTKRGLATFSYSQGIHEVEPPSGWEDYFGSRPLYRFLDTTRGDTFEILRRLRHVPHGMNPEDTMRMFQSANRDGEEWHQRAWRECLDAVFQSLEEDKEINAIIGYSEGAMVAASLVVEEGERAKREGRERRIKFAIFVSGAPPLKMEGENKIAAQLADEIAQPVIEIPTFHIFGCDDAFLSSAVALYNVCDQEKAEMYDHGLGHIVPRDAENVKLLGQTLQGIIPAVEEEVRREAARRDACQRARVMRRLGSVSGEAGRMDRIERIDFSTAMLRPLLL